MYYIKRKNRNISRTLKQKQWRGTLLYNKSFTLLLRFHARRDLTPQAWNFTLQCRVVGNSGEPREKAGLVITLIAVRNFYRRAAALYEIREGKRWRWRDRMYTHHFLFTHTILLILLLILHCSLISVKAIIWSSKWVQLKRIGKTAPYSITLHCGKRESDTPD